jgi:uncharacterized protein YndB with AHSA1/START domain
MSTQATDLTIRRAVNVERSVEDAFRVFTEGMGRWWPVERHSVGDEKTKEAVMETRPGGRIFERWVDGREHETWGEILTWEPPHRVVFWWAPGGAKHRTEVEVRFSADADSTRVELEHRGWEAYGDEAKDASTGYANGWPFVLGRFVDTANAER